jgi:hypothetical protein
MTVNIGRKTHLKKYLPCNGKWQFFPVAKVNGRPEPELVLIDGKPIKGNNRNLLSSAVRERRAAHAAGREFAA